MLHNSGFDEDVGRNKILKTNLNQINKKYNGKKYAYTDKFWIK